MPVLQKMSIRLFRQFPTLMHSASGEMYIRHRFRNRGLCLYKTYKCDGVIQL